MTPLHSFANQVEAELAAGYLRERGVDVAVAGGFGAGVFPLPALGMGAGLPAVDLVLAPGADRSRAERLLGAYLDRSGSRGARPERPAAAAGRAGAGGGGARVRRLVASALRLDKTWVWLAIAVGVSVACYGAFAMVSPSHGAFVQSGVGWGYWSASADGDPVWRWDGLLGPASLLLIGPLVFALRSMVVRGRVRARRCVRCGAPLGASDDRRCARHAGVSRA